MANDASKVQLIKDGEIWLKDYEPGEAVPTGPDFNPAVHDYAHAGYYSSDGFTLHPEIGDTSEHKAQNGEVVLEDDQPGFFTIAFSGLETRKEIAEAYFDVVINPDGSFTVITVGSSRRYTMFIRGVDQSGEQMIFAHLPKLKVSDREDMTFNIETLRAYGLTFKTFQGEGDVAYHLKVWDKLLDTRPVVTGAEPPEAETGDEVTITGLNFTGATNVKFGATNAADFDVVSDTEITAEMPAGSAGSAAVKVTTPAGESNSFAYTRGGSGA